MHIDNNESLSQQLTNLIGRDMTRKLIEFFGPDIGDLHELFRRLDQWTEEFVGTEGANNVAVRDELKSILTLTISEFAKTHELKSGFQFEVVCDETNNPPDALMLAFDVCFKLADTHVLFFRNLVLEAK